MKRILLLLIICLPFMCTSCVKRIVDTTITVYGTVIDLETQMPIEGVSVTITPGAKNKVTGSDGYFEFVDLENRQYTLTAQKNGYSTDRKSITTVAGDNAEVTFLLKKNQ